MCVCVCEHACVVCVCEHACVRANVHVCDLQARLNDITSGQNVVTVSKILGVSPNSMEKVKRAVQSKSGTLQSDTTSDASTPPKGQRNKYLEKVTKSLTPAITKLCELAKFKDGKTDSGGVASMVMGRIAR